MITIVCTCNSVILGRLPHRLPLFPGTAHTQAELAMGWREDYR